MEQHQSFLALTFLIVWRRRPSYPKKSVWQGRMWTFLVKRGPHWLSLKSTALNWFSIVITQLKCRASAKRLEKRFRRTIRADNSHARNLKKGVIFTTFSPAKKHHSFLSGFTLGAKRVTVLFAIVALQCQVQIHHLLQLTLTCFVFSSIFPDHVLVRHF